MIEQLVLYIIQKGILIGALLGGIVGVLRTFVALRHQRASFIQTVTDILGSAIAGAVAWWLTADMPLQIHAMITMFTALNAFVLLEMAMQPTFIAKTINYLRGARNDRD